MPFCSPEATPTVASGFELIAKGGQDVPLILDVGTGVWENTTFLDHFTDRPQQQVRVDGNYYVAEAMGGDHEFKFGFLYRDISTTSAYAYGNGNFMLTLNADPYLVYLYRDKPEGGSGDYAGTYTGFYVSDTYTRDRLTLNLGVRYDIQTSKANPSTVGANAVIPDLLPAIDFSGFESGTDWKDISPRIGLTYDLGELPASVHEMERH